MRPHPTLAKPPLSPSPLSTLTRYSFQLSIQQIHLSIKFPCKLTLSLTTPQSTLRGTKISPLLNNISKINQTLTFNTSLTTNSQLQSPQQSKASILINLITENGTSVAGVVYLNLLEIVEGRDGRVRKEVYQVDRCPDKNANVRMRVKWRCIGESVMREGVSSPTKQGRVNRGNSSQSQITLQRQIRNDSITTTGLIKQQVSTWKNRVTQYQLKYKNQKVQNNKLNQLLKGKQQIYLSLRAEIKRKEIQVQTVMKTLEEYKLEYERIRSQCEGVKKERDRFQLMVGDVERLGQERMGKLEGEVNGNVKKIERLLKQNQNLKRERIPSTTFIRSPEPTVVNSTLISQLKKQKQNLEQQLKLQRQSYQKQLRQLKSLLAIKQQSYSQLHLKHESLTKKFQKLQQSRTQDLHKLTLKMLQIEKSKQSFTSQLYILKKDRSKKDLNTHGQLKTVEKQLSEQSGNNMRLAQTVTELQGEKMRLSKEGEEVRRILKVVEEEKAKYEKEVEHLKYQIRNLNQLLVNRDEEIKEMGSTNKQYQEIYRKKIQSLQQQYLNKKNQFTIQLQQLKRSQQSKYISLTQILIKKQQQSQSTTIRQQKLSLTISSLQQQLHKLSLSHTQSISSLKSSHQQLTQQHSQQFSKLTLQQKYLHQHIHQLQLQIQSLNIALTHAKESQFRLLEREEQNRMELQELKRVWSEGKMEIMQLREELEEERQKGERGKKRQVEIGGEIGEREGKWRGVEKELREKIVGLQGERMKLVSLLKQKQKTNNQSLTLLRQQNSSLLLQLQKLQHQSKTQYDSHRQLLHKHHLTQNSLSIQIDRLTNQLTRVTSSEERGKIYVDQLEADVGRYKEMVRQMGIEREGMQEVVRENQGLRREVEGLRVKEGREVSGKEREIRNLRIKVQEMQRQTKQIEMIKGRVGMLLDQIHLIVLRINGERRDNITDQYEKVMQIRKQLFYVESKMVKQNEKVSGYQKIEEEKQGMRVSIERFSVQKIEFKSREVEWKRNEEILKREIELLKKNKDQLFRQLHMMNNESQKPVDNSAILMNQINHLKQMERDYQIQLKTNSERYESIIIEIRTQCAQKLDKNRRQLVNENRRLESKSQQLQHKIFTLEIQNQRIPQLSRKDQQIRRMTGKVFQLQKQLVQMSQQILSTKQYQPLPLPNKTDQILKFKLQKQLVSLTNDHQRLNTKYKQLNHLLKQKESQLEKLRLSIHSMKSQFNYQKSILQQQKSFSLQTEGKLRIEIDKLKGEIVMLKRINEQSRSKIFQLQSINISKTELQKRTKQTQINQLQRINTQLNEQLFSANQINQQLRWQLQQTITLKDNQIMSIQQQLYSINSKQNIRILKESQYLERVKILDGEKRELEYLLEQSRSMVVGQGQSIREMEEIIRDQQGNIEIAVENQRKYEGILRSLRMSSRGDQ